MFNHNDKKSSISLHYLSYQYPKEHWAVDPIKEGTGIAFFTVNNCYRYVVKLNPSDSRGYRFLVSYIGKTDQPISNSFNRPYQSAEELGLLDVTAIMMAVYYRLNIPIVQCAQAGNNAHSFDSLTKTIHIGNPKEPGMLHMHGIGRGDTTCEYIMGVPLEGPELGVTFDMRGETPDVPGNSKKIKWQKDQLSKALATIKGTLVDYIKTSEFQKEFAHDITIQMVDYQKDLKLSITMGTLNRFKMFNLSDYPKDHWVFHPKKDDVCIGFFDYLDQYRYVLQLNRYDSRGDRLLITYLGKKNQTIFSSFKYPYEVIEQRGLFTVAHIVSGIYKQLGFPIVQILQPGNNSQGIDQKTHTILLGNQNEPNRLLVHVIGRGNPEDEYISIVPLQGPVPGEIFDTRGATPHIAGNQKRIPWNREKQMACLETMKAALSSYKASEEYLKTFSNKVTIEIEPPPLHAEHKKGL